MQIGKRWSAVIVTLRGCPAKAQGPGVEAGGPPVGRRHRPVGDLTTGLAFLEHDRDPMAWEQLFGSLKGLMLVGSEDGRHRNALGQVSDYVE